MVERFYKTKDSGYTGVHMESINLLTQSENMAVYNVDKEAELAVKVRLIDLAMSKLSCIQKKVIHRAN
ncbi:hypothetical protein D3C74_282580 [compost metagenome]